ncbi:hypothetical protein [Paraburkholderia unamae]|uniref:Uncharacterized protein n=1 Tax=Paraburkholderia unamae TaxID=219649 RepID=A0ABX5KGE5_9BURK|nr:hypothetical protein [Paraburkholderia unamae]PVX75204.1 hypothetical protein C7402_118136 [Paraburkholderia unamae]
MSTVFLLDPLVCLGKPDLYLKVNQQLQGYFDRVGRAMRPAEKILVAWIPAAPTPTPLDLLVYFTPVEYSVVSRFFGKPVDPLAVSHWGYTQFQTANGRVTVAASEVYAKSLEPDLLAKLAFHELMHNKLVTGNGLHTRNGLAQATVGPNTDLSAENIADLAAAMHNPVPQWTGGVDLLLSARRLRDAGDPLWYL